MHNIHTHTLYNAVHMRQGDNTIYNMVLSTIEPPWPLSAIVFYKAGSTSVSSTGRSQHDKINLYFYLPRYSLFDYISKAAFRKTHSWFLYFGVEALKN